MQLQRVCHDTLPWLISFSLGVIRTPLMPLRSPQKVRQQRRVLLLALYILKRRGHDRPPKKQVLNFISWQRLMHVPADDSDLRSTGDEIWENDLAWKRADLKKDG